MKFKVLFITFNIVLFLSFLTIFFIPFFILDSNYMMDFWVKNWFFIVFFILIMFVVNMVFFSNWKMLSFLEKEDWPGLSSYLETEIFIKNRFGKRRTALLCDSLLLLRDFETLIKLETLLKTKKPRLFVVLGMKFASFYLLSGNYEAMHSLASGLMDEKGADTEWLSFYAFFSRHLAKKYEEACSGFILLCSSAKDPLVTALSSYMAGVILIRSLPGKEADLSRAAEEAKTRIIGKFTQIKWNTYLEEEKACMHVVVLGKMIGETETWLFS